MRHPRDRSPLREKASPSQPFASGTPDTIRAGPRFHDADRWNAGPRLIDELRSSPYTESEGESQADYIS
jgi:hypothetical protein